MIAAVGVVSLAYSVVGTALEPAIAYFETTTRVWEFAAGAVIALALPLLVRMSARSSPPRPDSWASRPSRWRRDRRTDDAVPGHGRAAPGGGRGARGRGRRGRSRERRRRGCSRSRPLALRRQAAPTPGISGTGRVSCSRERLTGRRRRAASAGSPRRRRRALAGPRHRQPRARRGARPACRAGSSVDLRRVALLGGSATATAVIALGDLRRPARPAGGAAGLIGGANCEHRPGRRDAARGGGLDAVCRDARLPRGLQHREGRDGCVFGATTARRTIVLHRRLPRRAVVPGARSARAARALPADRVDEEGCPFAPGVHIYLPAIGREYGECLDWSANVIRAAARACPARR